MSEFTEPTLINDDTIPYIKLTMVYMMETKPRVIGFNEDMLCNRFTIGLTPEAS